MATLAATTAFAQSSVTIGGQLDVGLQNQKFANDKNVTNLGSGVHGASRVWFTGTEDLGGGNSANWRLEMQPSMVDGSTNANLFNRGAWAGLKGGWGELRAGRQATNTITAVCAIDQHGCYSGFYGGGLLFSGQTGPGGFAGSLMAANPTPAITSLTQLNSVATNTGAASQASSTAGDSTRYINQLRYTLPTFATGLTLNAAYAFGKSNATNSANGTDGDSYGFDAKYEAGPLTLVGSYQNAKPEFGVNKPSGDLTTVGGIYDFSVVKVGVGYQKEKAEKSYFKSAEGVAFTATIPLGAFTPYVKYGERKYTLIDSNKTYTSAKIANIGVRYALSKRSLIYVDYANNGADKQNILYTTATATSAASLKTQTSIGLQHNF